MQGYASDLQVLFGILFTNIKLRKITVHDIASQSDTSRLAKQGITGHYQAQPGRTHHSKARPFQHKATSAKNIK